MGIKIFGVGSWTRPPKKFNKKIKKGEKRELWKGKEEIGEEKEKK